MSDMIDRLDQIAGEVGADVGERLGGASATLNLQIRRQVRHRRRVAAALAGVLAVMVAASVVVVPKLISTPVEPAGIPKREVVVTEEGLVTYSDASMQVVTSAGKLVTVPAAGYGAPGFAAPSIPGACAVDAAALTPGWSHAFTDAAKLMTFGRPLLVDDTGYHVLAQGQEVTLHGYRKAMFAASVDVDPAIAPYVVMSAVVYVLAPDGRTAYVTSQMESQPAIEYSGQKGTPNYTATVTGRGMYVFDECEGVAGTFEGDSTSGLVYVMSAHVFINDGHGHVNPLGTHNSWFTVSKEDS